MTNVTQAFLQAQDMHALKRRFGLAFPEAGHGRALELLARILGRNTFAALTADLAKGPVSQDVDPAEIERGDTADAVRKAHGKDAPPSVEGAAKAAMSALSPFCEVPEPPVPETIWKIIASLRDGMASPVQDVIAGLERLLADDGPEEAAMGFHRQDRQLGSVRIYRDGHPKTPGAKALELRLEESGEADDAYEAEIRKAVRIAERLCLSHGLLCVVRAGNDGPRDLPRSSALDRLRHSLAASGYADVGGLWCQGNAWIREVGSGDGIEPWRPASKAAETGPGSMEQPMLLVPGPGRDTAAFAHEVAAALIPRDRRDSYFADKARAALAGLIQLLIAKVGEARDYQGIPVAWHGRKPSLPMLADWIALQHVATEGGSEDPVADWLKAVSAAADPRHGGRWSSKGGWIELTPLLAMAPKERAGVLGTMDQGLLPYKYEHNRQEALAALMEETGTGPVTNPGSRIRAKAASIARPILNWQAIEEVEEIAINRPGEIWLRLRKPDEEGRTWLRREDTGLTSGYLADTIESLAAMTGIENFRPGGTRVCYGTLPGGYHFVGALGENFRSGTGSQSGTATTAFYSRRSGAGPKADPRAPFPRRKDDAGSADVLSPILSKIGRGEHILISGRTGVGKTTLLKGIGALLPADFRVLTLEDTPEIEVSQQNHLRIVTSRDAGRSGLKPESAIDLIVRAGPEALLVGEVTTQSANMTWELMRSAAYPVISTIHADSAADAITGFAGRIAGGRPMPRGARAALIKEIGERTRVIHIDRDEAGVRRIAEAT